MDIGLKRIIAFLIDMFLVSFIVVGASRYLHLDPYIEKYDEAFTEYSELATETENLSDVDKDRLIELNYDVYRYGVVNNAISIGMLILYFGILEYVCKGETPGKRLMKLRLVSNSDKKLNIFQYLLRVTILNGIIFSLLIILAVYLTDGLTFNYISYFLSLAESTILLINVMMITMRSDHRGLHDIISGTKVIDTKLVNDEEIVEPKETIKEKAQRQEKKKNKVKE